MCRPDSRRCARDGALRSPTMRVLLVTPPMTQLNTPYPATAYLTGFLRQHAAELGLEVTQADASLELFLRLFSPRWADARWPTSCAGARAPRSASARRRRSRTSSRTPSATSRPSSRRPLPAGPRSRASRCASSAARSCPRARASRARRRRRRRGDDPLAWAFGDARHRRTSARTSPASTSTTSPTSSRDGIDPRFELSRYGEKLAASAPTLRSAARGARRASRRWSTSCSTSSRASCVARARPDVVGLTAPFPGNVYGAFRMARAIKRGAPGGDARARRRLRQHRAARARASRACSTTSTTSRSTTASGRC